MGGVEGLSYRVLSLLLLNVYLVSLSYVSCACVPLFTFCVCVCGACVIGFACLC